MAESPILPRAKRQKIDKSGRHAAFEKLKNLKGQKHKLEVKDDIDNVYDLVDERELLERNKNHLSDWIEDDGSGYVYNDSDISDDGDERASEDNKRKLKDSKKRLRGSDISKNKSTIRSLFTKVKVEDDNILADILGEINPTTSKASPISLSSHTKTNNNLGEPHTSKVVTNVVKESQVNQEPLESHKIYSIDIKSCENIDVAENKNCSEQNENGEIKRTDGNVTQQTKSKTSLETHMKEDKVTSESEKTINESKVLVTPQCNNTEQINTDELFSEDFLLNNWEKICGTADFNETTNLTESKSDISTLDVDILKMWYWDIWEDPFKKPGQIFIFGKTEIKPGEFQSICVQVENVDKCIYLLPREYILDPATKQPSKTPVTLKDVYNEFNTEIAPELGITCFRSKMVSKSFAFEVPGLHVPRNADYLEVRYKVQKGTPNNLRKNHNSIAHIFGLNTSVLEQFLLERKIKGPCWLDIKRFHVNAVSLSYCKVEVKCGNELCVSVSDARNQPPPPISVLVLNVTTILNAKTLKNEVAMISCLTNSKFTIDKPPKNPPFEKHFCGFTRPINQNWPFDINQKLSGYTSTKTKKFDSERALLSWFLATYQNIDPDLLVTYDANDCQLDVLCNRITILKIPLWSRLSKLKMTQITGKKYNDFFIGRLLCDVKQSAEELIKSRSYDLGTICLNVLKIKDGERKDLNNDEISTMYEKSVDLLKLISLTMQDAFYIMRLMCELNVLPLALQITNICGNIMSRTLQGGRSQRNEFLLLHAFYEKNYIVPDKHVREINVDNNEVSGQSSNRKKAAYSGGLVLEPIKGFYEKYILLMDFNSLYPSIIQEYNICFTTVNQPENEDTLPNVPDSNVEQGVLPRQIRRLVESRREVKKLMLNIENESDQKVQYNIRQLALKLTANSMYGCLGFSHSRFFAQHLAALITHKGREILMNTKSLVQKLNYEVIYGDTDSIMVNTNSTDYDQVFKIGSNIKNIVNKTYKQIELDIDGVFKYLLLLKKKKYAALTISKNQRGEIVLNQEHKGLDIVRRDWSRISVMSGKIVLDEILSDNQLDEKIENIHSHLEKVKNNLLSGSVAPQLLSITKQLTKAPKDYPIAANLPHVQVAIRMNKNYSRRYKKGDMVSYVICDDGTENPAMQRAYHVDELKSSSTLKIDSNYYLAHQIHPVVSRICEPLEGTDNVKVAECLGLDANKFKTAIQRAHNERIEDASGESVIKTAVQKYRQCEKFKFKCQGCGKENLVASGFRPKDNKLISVLETCSNDECDMPPYQYISSIKNEIILAIRRCIQRFYENWLVCDDPSCNSNTRSYSHVVVNNKPVCSTCKQGTLVRQYSQRDLYHQLTYYHYIFDLAKQGHKCTLAAPAELAYDILKNAVLNELERSAYSHLNFSRLFQAPYNAHNVKSDNCDVQF